METKGREQIVAEFAKAWETLDAELIISNLDECFVYDSQWVLASLNYYGYKDYIQGKFRTIKETGNTPKVKIVPDNYFGGSMIALQQGENAPAFYRIKVKNGKVIKGDLCMF